MISKYLILECESVGKALLESDPDLNEAFGKEYGSFGEMLLGEGVTKE